MSAPRIDIAILVATSGHSGVDTIIRNLAHEIHRRGFVINALRIDNHGPRWEEVLPATAIVRLGTAHVDTSLPRLVAYLRRVRPRVLMTDKDRVNRVAVLARAMAGVDTRLVIRVGTTFSKNLERRGRWQQLAQRLSARFLYPRADAVIVPSAGAARDLHDSAGVPARLIKALPSPVITDRVMRAAEQPPAHPWLTNKSVPVFLGVGELCARKDFSTLIRAFARVRTQTPSRLIILGEGGKRRELESLVRELGLAGDVDLPGFVANPYAFMHNADVFVLSSKCEGSPVVLMEALGLGMHCVATDCPSGPREVLEGGRYGALVPVADAPELANRMAEALGEAPGPPESAARSFTVNHATDRYLEVLGLAGGGDAR